MLLKLATVTMRAPGELYKGCAHGQMLTERRQEKLLVHMRLQSCAKKQMISSRGTIKVCKNNKSNNKSSSHRTTSNMKHIKMSLWGKYLNKEIKQHV